MKTTKGAIVKSLTENQKQVLAELRRRGRNSVAENIEYAWGTGTVYYVPTGAAALKGLRDKFNRGNAEAVRIEQEIFQAAPVESASTEKRGVVCCFCGKAWGYAGEKPTEEVLKSACDHERQCPKNLYLAIIKELVSALKSARWHVPLHAKDCMVHIEAAIKKAEGNEN